MRNGHRGSGFEGLPVNFGLMLLDDFRVVADQPFPADGETAQAFAFRDSGFLENPKTAAARSNKDKLCPVFTDLIRGKIFDANPFA